MKYQTLTLRKHMQEATRENFPEIQSDRYRVLEVLGAGAVGTVYKAEDTALGITVAIKKLHKTASGADAVRFQREAKLAGSLTHPNVLRVFDVGSTSKNEPYLVLSYVEGQNLAERILKTDKLDLMEAIDIFIQIARGLSHAHQKNVVHRDIKPTNIMLLSNPPTEAEHVKIVDFGLAKSKSDEQDVTKLGVGLGTPVYMSPEQMQGREVDARSDLYSFGCVMHEVLTGQPPFSAESIVELIEMKLGGEKLSVVENDNYQIPTKLENIINQCLRPNCDERYQNAGQILRDLEHVRADLLGFSDILPAGTVQQESKRIDWQPVLFLALLAVLVMTIPIGFSHLLSLGKDREVKDVTSIHEFVYSKEAEDSDPDAGATTDAKLKQFVMRNQGKRMPRLRITDSKVTPDGYKQLLGYDVREVQLRGGSVDRETLKSLAQISSITKITLEGNDSIDPAAFAELAKMPHLREFHLTGQQHITKDHIDAIANITPLVRVEVHHSQCKISGGFTRWKQLPRLKTVMLDFTDVQDSDIADFADMPLRRLTLDMTGVSGKSIDTVIRMKKLKAVSFEQSEKITDADYDRLRKERPDIKINDEYKIEQDLESL